jgi:hypothetical protein
VPVSDIPFEQLQVLWSDGEARLRAAEPGERRIMERVIDTIGQELRRRLGGAFRSVELGRLYLEGTEWCFEVATKVAPDTPEAWDMSTIVNVSFSRYVRRASDYGGGRRRLGEDEVE